MKTLALVCNFVLLGSVGIGIHTGGTPKDPGSAILAPLMIAGLILNILMISGSSISPVKPFEKSILKESQGKWSLYLYLKFTALILNSILIAYILIKARGGSGYLFPYVLAFLIMTILLSIVRITISQWNRFAGLKRTMFLTGTILVLLFIGIFSTGRILTGNGIKENISIAEKEYPGKAEDALLAYLADLNHSTRERTEIAIWTLGQIRSRKALPVLKSLYKNEPGFKPCSHDSELCQYEIHKAIVSIESNWMGAKEKNIFGSWPGLNK